MRPRAMTIRSHLLLLAALAALPVLVFSVLISIMLIDQEQRTFERSAVERARAMMSAIDAELRGSFATLDALAASRFLLADDLPGFRDSADRLLGTQPGWYNVTLAVPSGQKIMDLRTPLGAPPELVIDWPSGKQVLETRQAVVGNAHRIAGHRRP